MRFISLFTHEPTGTVGPTPELMAEMGKLIEEGMKAGWLIATEGVQNPDKGVRVHQGRGKVTVTDGPFSEAKEVIGGYAILQARSKEEVVELCRRFLKVAGDGTCEVHQIYEAPAGEQRR